MFILRVGADHHGFVKDASRLHHTRASFSNNLYFHNTASGMQRTLISNCAFRAKIPGGSLFKNKKE
jgi:hypothetical protein